MEVVMVKDLMYTKVKQHIEAIKTAEQITGSRDTLYGYITNAFCSGWRDALEAAGKGELLAENDELQGAFADLGPDQRDYLALKQFASDILTEITDHPDNCNCFGCQAWRKYTDTIALLVGSRE
jgi:hypothetical protein